MPGERTRRTPLGEAFERAIDALAAAGADYALIGGFAVAYHGLPRPTRDVDVLLRVPRVSLPGLLDEFRSRGFEFDQRRVLEELRDDHLSEIRFQRVRVDLLEAVLPLFSRAVDRATTMEIGRRRVRVVGPEELIALKMVAGRDDDLRDVRGILATQGTSIDLERIRNSLRECCEAQTLDLFEQLRKESGHP